MSIQKRIDNEEGAIFDDIMVGYFHIFVQYQVSSDSKSACYSIYIISLCSKFASTEYNAFFFYWSKPIYSSSAFSQILHWLF